jgi:hypothetical protein
MTPLDAALDAAAAGLSVVPPREDGSKRPLAEWKDYQVRAASLDQVRAWYANGRAGLGLVCGAVSGNLELLEFEAEDVYEAYAAAADALGLSPLVDRIEAGYLEQSPAGGLHWLYRCPVIEGNTKLARRPKTPDEQRDPGDRVQVLIETRGEGGYVIVAPSAGRVHPTGQPYVRLRGDLAHVATISPEERRALFDLARTFDQLPKPTPRPAPAARSWADGEDRLSPGDDYNRRASWAGLLEPAGWTLAHRAGDVEYWRKPGKTSPGHSATVGHVRDRDGRAALYVFTTATAFDADKSYDLFGAYAVLHHGGDHAAAGRELARRGYGAERPAALRVVPEPPDDGWEPPSEEGPPGDRRGGAQRWRLTDYGNAERLVATHGRDLRHCHPWVKWLAWDGRRWVVDDTGEVMRRAKATVRDMKREADQ